MDRRRFLRAAAVAGASLVLGSARRTPAAPGAPDLVAVKNGEPASMFDRAIQEWGGMKAFVKKGQKVLVKPNIGWDLPPELGANTHPALVARIVEQALAAGARQVFVFDHSCADGARSYRTSGIAAAARAAGAKVAPASVEGAYHPVKVPGKALTDAKVHELLIEADVFINVPVLKCHSSAAVTAGMKNLMGVVWDRAFWHRTDLMQCIADMAAYRKPDLTVVDAYRVMIRHGPRGGEPDDVETMKMQILSTDPVAADMAGARLLYQEPRQAVAYLPLAAEAGLGSMDLGALDIRRITL